MSLAVTAVIGAAVGVGSLAFTIANSQQQARLASQSKDAARIDAESALKTAAQQKSNESNIEQRNVNLMNERRRVGAPMSGVTTGIPPAAWSANAAPASTSPVTVNRGQGSVVGS